MLNLKGIGIDIIDVTRIAKLMHNQCFLQRCYTPAELEYCFKKRFPQQSLAGRFAAKEAAGKAIGTGIINKFFGWQDIEIIVINGKPNISLKGKIKQALENASFLLSISHTETQAAAIVYFKCRNFDNISYPELARAIDPNS